MPIIGTLRERIVRVARHHRRGYPRHVDFYVENPWPDEEPYHLNVLASYAPFGSDDARKEYVDHYYGAVSNLLDFRADLAQDNFESLKEMCRACRR